MKHLLLKRYAPTSWEPRKDKRGLQSLGISPEINENIASVWEGVKKIIIIK